MIAKHTGSLLSLEERLHRLGDSLQALRSQLQEAIARAVSEEVASTVRDAIRTLFAQLPQREPAQPHSGGWDSYEEEGPWSEQPWLGEHHEGFREREAFRPERTSHGSLYRHYDEPVRQQESRQMLLTGTLKLSLAWARKRPLLAAAVLAAALGGAAYLGGPALVGNAAAVVSLVGLALTAQNAPDALARLIEHSMV